MRLIINADDLGRSREVNEAVFTLMDLGLVTSATLMANSPLVDEALARLARFPGCSFGVHLNVTEFQPLTCQPHLDCLLDQAGNFSLGRFRQAALKRPLRRAIFKEWSCQVRKLQSSGLAISHIDSHHGIHTDGRLLGVLKRLQLEFGIRRVRIRESLAPSPRGLFIRASCWNLALRLMYLTKTTSGFTDFSTFLQAPRFYNGHYRTLEVMVHPGHPAYAGETTLLMSSWQQRLPFPVHLMSYHEI